MREDALKHGQTYQTHAHAGTEIPLWASGGQAEEKLSQSGGGEGAPFKRGALWSTSFPLLHR